MKINKANRSKVARKLNDISRKQKQDPKQFAKMEKHAEQIIDSFDILVDELEETAKTFYKAGRIKAFKRFDELWRNVSKLRNGYEKEVRALYTTLPDEQTLRPGMAASEDLVKIAKELIGSNYSRKSRNLAFDAAQKKYKRENPDAPSKSMTVRKNPKYRVEWEGQVAYTVTIKNQYFGIQYNVVVEEEKNRAVVGVAKHL